MACVHGRVRPVYTTVNVPGTRPCMGHVPCTQACLRFQPMNMALFTAHVHGRVHGLARAVYTVNGRVHGPYTGDTAVNDRVYFP